jgi:hypothetical protein
MNIIDGSSLLTTIFVLVDDWYQQKGYRYVPLLSCYAAKFDNHDLLELCGAGILPARIIQTKCTTAYQVHYQDFQIRSKYELLWLQTGTHQYLSWNPFSLLLSLNSHKACSIKSMYCQILAWQGINN